jgi:hypothetical protein
VQSGRQTLRRIAEYDLEHPDQVRERKRRYDQSKAGQAAHKRYYKSSKGRAVGARFKRFRRARLKDGTWE